MWESCTCDKAFRDPSFTIDPTTSSLNTIVFVTLFLFTCVESSFIGGWVFNPRESTCYSVMPCWILEATWKATIHYLRALKAGREEFYKAHNFRPYLQRLASSEDGRLVLEVALAIVRWPAKSSGILEAKWSVIMHYLCTLRLAEEFLQGRRYRLQILWQDRRKCRYFIHVGHR